MRLVAVPLALLGLATLATAATIHVDDDNCPGPGTGTLGDPYCLLQPAIDAAVAVADEVFVACGTYVETITMRDAVSIRGEGASCTTIDGGSAGSVVTMVDIGAGTVLEGLTLTNGRGDNGGGILIDGGAPTITRNVIQGNSAVVNGGFTGYGGGIQVQQVAGSYAAPLIVHNVIRNNTAQRYGGGIEISGVPSPVIGNNLIEGNTAEQSGGGIDSINSNPVIVHNTIVGNASTVQTGGGVALNGAANAEVSFNLIVDNDSDFGGAGIDLVNSTPVLTYNDVFENLPSNYSAGDDPLGADGNISADPLFVNAGTGDYRLASGSPAVDSIPAAIFEGFPCRDLDASTRQCDGDGDYVADRDMGAYERAIPLPEVDNLRFTTPADFEWDLEPAAFSYHVYRGDLAGLAYGNYGSCLTSTGATSTTDVQPLGQGAGFFYLISSEDGVGVEGTTGFGTCAQRSIFTQCP